MALKKFKTIIFLILLYNCDITGDYTENITNKIEYFNEGEGYNQIHFFDSKINSSFFNVKKYSFDEHFLCIWQADSLKVYNSKLGYYRNRKKNTIYYDDIFSIIDIKKDTLLFVGNYKNFKPLAANLKITVNWLPKTMPKGKYDNDD